MTEQQILYFLTLVEEKSFSKASKKLYVTQPSFSQYIQKFEKQMGARLFDRSSVPIRLTEEGEAVYRAVCEIRIINDNLKQQISSIGNLETGSIHIGATPFRGSTLLSKSIQRYHTEYPGIEISIIEKSLNELQTSLINGECDLAIGSGNVNQNLLHSEPLAKERLYMAVCPENPINENLEAFRLDAADILSNSLKLLRIQPCTLGQFSNEPYIMYDGNENIREVAKAIYEESHCSPNVFLTLQDMYTVFSFILANIGISIVPDSFIRYGNLKNHPYYYSLNSTCSTNDICLITKKNRKLTQSAYEYCRILKELIVSGTWCH